MGLYFHETLVSFGNDIYTNCWVQSVVLRELIKYMFSICDYVLTTCDYVFTTWDYVFTTCDYVFTTGIQGCIRE